jgi:hypothetical protein
VKTALFPVGRPEKLALSEVMASPSMSAARTVTVSGLASEAAAAAGAVTAGARSTLVMVIVVLIVAESPPAPVKNLTL